MPDKVIDGSHGWVGSQQPGEGNDVTYSCNPGFTLVGHPKRTCKNGEYDFVAPTCNGGKSEFAATDKDNVTSTEASTVSSPSSVATGGTHGNMRDVDTKKHTGHIVVIISVISTVT
ncbi:hypothetical protein CRUP_019553, partial [Coryphaenoides rupestris]